MIARYLAIKNSKTCLLPFLKQRYFHTTKLNLITFMTPGYRFSSRRSLNISIDPYHPVKGAAGNWSPPISANRHDTPGKGNHSKFNLAISGRLMIFWIILCPIKCLGKWKYYLKVFDFQTYLGWTIFTFEIKSFGSSYNLGSPSSERTIGKCSKWPSVSFHPSRWQNF